MYKQIIIARKDLGMSAGKLAAQVSHASMEFLRSVIREKSIPCDDFCMNETKNDCTYYHVSIMFEKDLYEQWLDDEFAKVVLQAKNKNDLVKAVKMAEDLGMTEGKDYFLIRDNCHTELIPEEDGKTLTCIGFRPMSCEEIDKIGREYHIYVG